MNFIWESFILILSGIFLLRLAGRKSISQMTLEQTVVIISIGTIIIQPIVEKCIKCYSKCTYICHFSSYFRISTIKI